MLVTLLSLIFMLFFTECNEPHKRFYKYAPKITTITSKSSTYERDSLYLGYTVNEFIKQEYHGFSGYKTFDKEIPPTSIFIDSIFYSPDSLRIFAFVILKVPNTEDSLKQNLGSYFNGHTLIGFRDNKAQPWKIYETMLFRASALDTYDAVQQAFRNYYFGKFKDASEYNLDKWGNWELNYFKYNLNEPEFWTKSIVWQKGLRIPGYYNFQLKGKYKPGQENIGVVPYLEINYPRSLLKRFK